MTRIISPSVLSADFGHLDDAVRMLDRSEAQWVHIDVMDGLFVPNISFGFPVIKAIRKATTKVLDTHLMIVEPERYIERFAEAGANILTVHFEAVKDLPSTLARIKAAGMKAGVSIKPHTPVSTLVPYLPEIDLVLIMSVEPGFGGQSFLEGSLEKIAELRREIEKCGAKTLIEVDGGITLENARPIFDAGADAIVAGYTVFATPDPAATIHRLLNV